MTQPAAARPYASYTDAQLKQLLDDARGPARRQVQQELDFRRANPGSGPTSVNPPVSGDATTDQLQQQFLAQQAWAGMTTDQQALVQAHVAAQVSLAQANDTLAKATASANQAQQQFESARTQVQAAATAATAVVSALPSEQQARLADVAKQVPQLVEQVAALSSSVTDAATAATSAQAQLSAAQTQVEQAVVAAVTVATAPGADAPVKGDATTRK